jgi:hypothetical protein
MSAIEHERENGRSLGALAKLAMRQTNAAGYALYEVDGESGEFVQLSKSGKRVPDIRELRDVAELDSQGGATRSFGLWSGDALAGVILFVFDRDELAPEVHATLERSARTIEKLFAQFRKHDAQVRLAVRIGELEADLTDEKIADRVAGILQNGTVNDGAIDAMERHVQAVLSARSLDRVLEELLHDLEQRTAERGLLAQAKTLLQNRKGLSEHQAHIQLRIASRRNRRRVGDVAREVIQELEAQAK